MSDKPDESKRRKAEAELAESIHALRLRVAHCCCEIRLAMEEAKNRNKPNDGGNNNGHLPQLPK